MKPWPLPVLVIAAVAVTAAVVSPTIAAFSVRAEVRAMREDVGELNTYVRIVEQTRQRVVVEWEDTNGLVWDLTTVRYASEDVESFSARHAESLYGMLALWPSR